MTCSVLSPASFYTDTHIDTDRHRHTHTHTHTQTCMYTIFAGLCLQCYALYLDAIGWVVVDLVCHLLAAMLAVTCRFQSAAESRWVLGKGPPRRKRQLSEGTGHSHASPLLPYPWFTCGFRTHPMHSHLPPSLPSSLLFCLVPSFLA